MKLSHSLCHDCSFEVLIKIADQIYSMRVTKLKSKFPYVNYKFKGIYVSYSSNDKLYPGSKRFIPRLLTLLACEMFSLKVNYLVTKKLNFLSLA